MNMSMHPKARPTAQLFLDQVREAFGKELLSVTAYGSALTPDYHQKKSDHNFLVVLTPEGISQIRRIQGAAGGWTRRRIHFPMFMTKEFIDSSLDSYPVEFFNMKQFHEVLAGEDVLRDLVIPRDGLRLQCERDLKGKLLHLRQEYVYTMGKTGRIRGLVNMSLAAFTSIFRALLHLKGVSATGSIEETLNQACGEFHMDIALFQSLAAIRQKGITYAKFELENLMERYISEIERLCRQVDGMELKYSE
jgi:hypothetical protein